MTRFMIFTLLFFPLNSIFASSECDKFQSGLLCSLYPADNILGLLTDVEDEIRCQKECIQLDGCEFFTFEEFTSGNSDCFLFSNCNPNDTIPCIEKPECGSSVSGPSKPQITDSWCSDFIKAACPMEFQIDEVFEVESANLCQNICRDTANCSYYTIMDDICFLYSACDNPHNCHSCSSGPAFPDVSKCDSDMDVLLLGG